MDYQSFTQEQISSDIWKKVEVKDGSYQMDVVWSFLRTVLLNLSQIAMAVLVISHRNAGEERIFSIVRKNKTKFRSRLELGRSLNSIMTVKSAILESLVACNEWKPIQDLLKKCKSATTIYNEQHK